jgi:hypothetical protein
LCTARERRKEKNVKKKSFLLLALAKELQRAKKKVLFSSNIEKWLDFKRREIKVLNVLVIIFSRKSISMHHTVKSLCFEA